MVKKNLKNEDGNKTAITYEVEFIFSLTSYDDDNDDSKIIFE